MANILLLYFYKCFPSLTLPCCFSPSFPQTPMFLQVFPVVKTLVVVPVPRATFQKLMRWSLSTYTMITCHIKYLSSPWYLTVKQNVLLLANFTRSSASLMLFLQALSFWRQQYISLIYYLKQEKKSRCAKCLSCIRH